MQPITSKRLYSPQLSNVAVISIRRLAWAMDYKMPKAVDHIVQLLPHIVDPLKVCNLCQDKSRCALCVFSKTNTEPEASPLSALM